MLIQFLESEFSEFKFDAPFSMRTRKATSMWAAASIRLYANLEK